MKDCRRKPSNIQNRIAWPFLVIAVPLVFAAPILGTLKGSYGEYAMSAVFILLILCFATLITYNKIVLGVWFPGRRNTDPE
jgi:lipopolysaccharide export LptBFGC system permease protein LptF